jgi:galactokinase
MKRRASIPARINIIGEHTDYAGGKALPFAVDVRMVLEATALDEGFEGGATVLALWKAAGGWPARLTVESDIPIGVGMSSSAALCLAVVLCVNGPMKPFDACLEAQRLEHEVLKTPCGLLDQMAMMFAKEGHASLLISPTTLWNPTQFPPAGCSNWLIRGFIGRSVILRIGLQWTIRLSQLMSHLRINVLSLR